MSLIECKKQQKERETKRNETKSVLTKHYLNLHDHQVMFFFSCSACDECDVMVFASVLISTVKFNSDAQAHAQTHTHT